MCESKGEKDMLSAQPKVRVNKGIDLTSNVKSNIPHLKMINGSVVINSQDDLQKKWFKEFKR